MAISVILEQLLWNGKKCQNVIKRHKSPENDRKMVKRKCMDKTNSQIQKTKEVQDELQPRNRE